jgi:hypothetical protein
MAEDIKANQELQECPFDSNSTNSQTRTVGITIWTPTVARRQ